MTSDNAKEPFSDEPSQNRNRTGCTSGRSRNVCSTRCSFHSFTGQQTHSARKPRSGGKSDGLRRAASASPSLALLVAPWTPRLRLAALVAAKAASALAAFCYSGIEFVIGSKRRGGSTFRSELRGEV